MMPGFVDSFRGLSTETDLHVRTSYCVKQELPNLLFVCRLSIQCLPAPCELEWVHTLFEMRFGEVAGVLWMTR